MTSANEIYACFSECFIVHESLHSEYLKMKLVTIFMCKTVWNCWCIGNSMWASLWSTTISKAWNLHLLLNNLSNSSLYSNMHSLDIHGQVVSIDGSGPWNCNGSWQIYNLAHACIVCLPISSVISSVFPVSNPDSSHVLELLCSSMSPYTSLLDSTIQNKIRHYWSGFISRISFLV